MLEINKSIDTNKLFWDIIKKFETNNTIGSNQIQVILRYKENDKYHIQGNVSHINTLNIHYFLKK